MTRIIMIMIIVSPLPLHRGGRNYTVLWSLVEKISCGLHEVDQSPLSSQVLVVVWAFCSVFHIQVCFLFTQWWRWRYDHVHGKMLSTVPETVCVCLALQAANPASFCLCPFSFPACFGCRGVCRDGICGPALPGQCGRLWQVNGDVDTWGTEEHRGSYSSAERRRSWETKRALRQQNLDEDWRSADWRPQPRSEKTHNQRQRHLHLHRPQVWTDTEPNWGPAAGHRSEKKGF